jgi:hypothetical protein
MQMEQTTTIKRFSFFACISYDDFRCQNKVEPILHKILCKFFNLSFIQIFHDLKILYIVLWRSVLLIFIYVERVLLWRQ